MVEGDIEGRQHLVHESAELGGPHDHATEAALLAQGMDDGRGLDDVGAGAQDHQDLGAGAPHLGVGHGGENMLYSPGPLVSQPAPSCM